MSAENLGRRPVIVGVGRQSENPLSVVLYLEGSMCFALKLALQRGEGEKREGVEISKQSIHEPLTS